MRPDGDGNMLVNRKSWDEEEKVVSRESLSEGGETEKEKRGKSGRGRSVYALSPSNV